jgi:hypothetical protein
MKLVGFDKRAYTKRGMALAFLLIVSWGYWYKWFQDGERQWLAAGIGTTLATVLLIFVSSHKRYLIILGLDTLLALGFLGTMRYWITGQPVLPGVIALVVILCLGILLRIDRPDVEKNLDREAVGENTGAIELNLRGVPAQDAEKESRENRK